MADLHRLVVIARGEVGAVEQGGNNLGPSVVKYQMATWLAPGPWPWCAAFVCWCIREWISTMKPDDPIFGHQLPTRWRPRSAAAWDFEKWALARGYKILGENAPVREGDIVTFDMSHVGIVVQDEPTGKAAVRTVEGNTSAAGGRDSANGDGVFEKLRPRPLLRAVIRMERA